MFQECKATILAIRTAEGLVDVVEGAGTLCGIVLDSTVLYAEAGGQAEDHGFIIAEEDEVRICFFIGYLFR